MIYIEKIFALNLMMNLYLLKLTAGALKKPVCPKRLILGSFLGSAGYCILLVLPRISYTLKMMAGMLPVGMLMVKLGLKTKSGKELLYGTGWMFTFAFFLGGFIIFLKGKLPGIYRYAQTGMVVAGGGLIGYELLEAGMKKLRRRSQTRFCRVRLETDRGRMEISALVDTGNGLTDPVSHKPVAVLEADIWQDMSKWMRPEKYRVIPYHSIGKEHGILEAYEMDGFEVISDTSIKKQSNVVLAIFKGKLSKSGGYQMILPPELYV